MDIVKACRERAESYGALRQSAPTARVLDAAAAEIERLRLELAGRDATLRPFRVGNFIKSEEDLAEYRRAIIEGVEAEIAAWLRTGAAGIRKDSADGLWDDEGEADLTADDWEFLANAIASGEYRKGEG